MATTNEMNERLVYERNLNLKLREAQRSLEAAVDMHQQEITRLRQVLDKSLAINEHLQAEYDKVKAALVEISRNRIHGKPTVAAEIAQSVLR